MGVVGALLRLEFSIWQIEIIIIMLREIAVLVCSVSILFLTQCGDTIESEEFIDEKTSSDRIMVRIYSHKMKFEYWPASLLEMGQIPEDLIAFLNTKQLKCYVDEKSNPSALIMVLNPASSAQRAFVHDVRKNWREITSSQREALIRDLREIPL